MAVRLSDALLDETETLTSINLDTVTEQGLYFCVNCTNGPEAVNGYLTVQTSDDPDYLVQEYITIEGYRYQRVKYLGVIVPVWHRMFHLNDSGDLTKLKHTDGDYLQFNGTYGTFNIGGNSSESTSTHFKTDRNSFTFDKLINASSMNATGNINVYGGNSTFGHTSNTNSYLQLIAGDTGRAELTINGSAQGTGVLFVGQSSSYGGGIFYNGDGTPSYATGESADRVSLFRRSNGVNHVVASWAEGSNNVTFTGSLTMVDWTVTSDERLKENIQIIEPAKAARILGSVGEYTYDKGEVKNEIGLIAQEFLDTEASSVVKEQDGYYTLSYREIAVLLQAARKHDLERICKLELRLNKAGL